MRKLILFLVLFNSGISFSQLVDSINYSPHYPYGGDTLKLYCYVQYPNTGCQLVKKDHYSGFNGYFLRAFHCSGFANTLCPTIDTFEVYIPVGYVGEIDFHFMPGYITDSVNCHVPLLLNGDTIPYPYSIFTKSIYIGDSTLNSNFEINPIYESEKDWKFYPNPTYKEIYFQKECDSKIDKLVVFDSNGKVVLSYLIDNDKERIPLQDLPAGSFMFALYFGEKILGIDRIVIQ